MYLCSYIFTGENMTKDEALRLALEALRKAMQGNLVFDEAMEAFKAIEAALEAKDEPVAFKIYKPTPPRGAIPNVRDAELPWVYDQDPSSGNVASMWVTPVKATPPQRKPLTDDEITLIIADCASSHQHTDIHLARAIEAAHGIKGEA